MQIENRDEMIASLGSSNDPLPQVNLYQFKREETQASLKPGPAALRIVLYGLAVAAAVILFQMIAWLVMPEGKVGTFMAIVGLFCIGLFYLSMPFTPGVLGREMGAAIALKTNRKQYRLIGLCSAVVTAAFYFCVITLVTAGMRVKDPISFPFLSGGAMPLIVCFLMALIYFIAFATAYNMQRGCTKCGELCTSTVLGRFQAKDERKLLLALLTGDAGQYAALNCLRKDLFASYFERKFPLDVKMPAYGKLDQNSVVRQLLKLLASNGDRSIHDLVTMDLLNDHCKVVLERCECGHVSMLHVVQVTMETHYGFENNADNTSPAYAIRREAGRKPLFSQRITPEDARQAVDMIGKSAADAIACPECGVAMHKTLVASVPFGEAEHRNLMRQESMSIAGMVFGHEITESDYRIIKTARYQTYDLYRYGHDQVQPHRYPDYVELVSRADGSVAYSYFLSKAALDAFLEKTAVAYGPDLQIVS